MSPPRVVLQTAIFNPGRIKAVVVNSLWRSRLLNAGGVQKKSRIGTTEIFFFRQAKKIHRYRES